MFSNVCAALGSILFEDINAMEVFQLLYIYMCCRDDVSIAFRIRGLSLLG